TFYNRLLPHSLPVARKRTMFNALIPFFIANTNIYCSWWLSFDTVRTGNSCKADTNIRMHYSADIDSHFSSAFTANRTLRLNRQRRYTNYICLDVRIITNDTAKTDLRCTRNACKPLVKSPTRQTLGGGNALVLIF